MQEEDGELIAQLNIGFEQWAGRWLAALERKPTTKDSYSSTVAYAKQSYGASIVCEFPDAFVDPYPEFFRALSAYAARGQSLTASLALLYGTAGSVTGPAGPASAKAVAAQVRG